MFNLRGRRSFCAILCVLICAAGIAGETADSKIIRPVEGIMDNSFLVEEAYNQEPGVVQNILTGLYAWANYSGTGDRRMDLAFTQEFPAWGQKNQLSYTIPYTFIRRAGSWSDGLNDVFLNYRYQAYYDDQTLTALAPRFSLILPTGTDEAGLQLHSPGYQWNLPFSTALGDRWPLNLNAGITFLPNAGPSRRNNLLNYNVGLSAIYCVSRDFDLMLEWVSNWTEASRDMLGIDYAFTPIISPGARYAFNFGNDAQLVIGAAVPLGLNRDAPNIGALFYLSYESRWWGKKE
jgi:hypothetical protein